MSSSHGTYWFWSDWLGDQAVRRLTPAERGVWIDCLALMAVANPAGYLCDEKGRPLTNEEIARLVNATPNEVAKLLAGILEKGVASRDRTGRLFNRRMVRKNTSSAKKARNGRLGGAATRMKWLAFSGLPQQMPQQMPQHRIFPLTKERKKEATDKENVKRPDQISKLELDELFEARRNGHGNGRTP